MKRLAPIALLALLLAVPVSGDVDDVRFVVTDHFWAPNLNDFETMVGACGGGTWLFDGDLLRFIETDDDPNSVRGDVETSCGSARVVTDVPAGHDHVHLHFTSGRDVAITADGVDVSLVEELRVVDASTDTVLQVIPFRPTGASDVPATEYEPAAIRLPDGLARVAFEWYFEDRGTLSIGGVTPAATSGVDYQATIGRVLIEFSDIPVQASISSDTERHGNLLRETLSITTPIAAAGHMEPDIRIRTEPHLRFDHVVLPDGTAFDAFATVEQATHVGYDLEVVQVEQQRAFLQVSLPAAMIAEHGEGNYTVRFISVETVEVVPALYPVLAVLFILPLPLAAVALRQANRFRREAFGSYRRSARNLQYAVVAVLIYYGAVVLSSLLSARLDLLVTWPLPGEAWAVYVQVVLAGGAFFTLWTVARELGAIVDPKD